MIETRGLTKNRHVAYFETRSGRCHVFLRFWVELNALLPCRTVGDSQLEQLGLPFLCRILQTKYFSEEELVESSFCLDTIERTVSRLLSCLCDIPCSSLNRAITISRLPTLRSSSSALKADFGKKILVDSFSPLEQWEGRNSTSYSGNPSFRA
jgi:hypothetical protein